MESCSEQKNHNFGDSEKHTGQFMFVAFYNVLAILISLKPHLYNSPKFTF